MKTEQFSEQFNALLSQFTELMTGEATEEHVEMVKIWALYSHMSMVMPPLIKHWASIEEHQDTNLKTREIFEEIQKMNEQNKKQIREHQSALNESN